MLVDEGGLFLYFISCYLRFNIRILHSLICKHFAAIYFYELLKFDFVILLRNLLQYAFI